jgi:group I intron endonuclease
MINIGNKCIIYLLINVITGKVYVGQTWQTLKNRWDSGHGYKKCVYLEKAIKKYGKNNFQYIILDIVSNQPDANWLENYWINIYNSRNKNFGYNIRLGGSNGKLSEETKEKLSKAKKGIMHTEDYKIMMSERMKGINTWSKGNTNRKGKKASEETKEKISKAGMGRKVSDLTKKKMSDSQKTIGNKPPPPIESGAVEASLKITKGKSWKVVNGKRVWVDKLVS